MTNIQKIIKKISGFTLIEIVVATAVFTVIAVGIYQAYSATMQMVSAARVKIIATSLANEQFEIARNLTYANVGISGGLPAGVIPHLQTLTRSGIIFTVETTIRNIDDPFDGTIGGTPNDLSPADRKFVGVEIFCPSCKNFSPLTFTTWVAPKALETASANGALFVQVTDESWQPVAGAEIHIENNQESPPFSIDDTTNNNGLLQIVDAPPGVGAYEITVSKTGYSTDQTYLAGDPGNPNPLKPHVNVSIQQLTETSFTIDRVSTLNIFSSRDNCSAVPSIDFSFSGAKLIGLSPDVLKYNASHITDGAGGKTLSGLESDTYDLSLTDGSYDLAGTIPALPFRINPNTNQDLRLIVAPKNPRSFLVSVKDGATQLSITGADVKLEKGVYDEALITGRGFLRQTDWSGGAGQADFTDSTQYFDDDGNIEVSSPAGEIRLKQVLGEYRSSGSLTSSTFDTGSPGNLHQILWEPQAQPPDTGADSVRFQIATNNDKTTWNFLGPDGTTGSYYTLTNQDINSLHDGDRYLRFRAYMQTASATWTPVISDIAFTFTSSCVPPGQVLFSGLDDGDYTITVSKSGYQTFVDTITIDDSWQQREVVLSP